MLDKKTVSQCISSDYCRGWNDAVDEMPHWISVEERLPEGEVIAANFAPGTYGYKEYLLGYVHKHDDLYYAENPFEILNTVTHWMPIPQPTKE